MVVVTLILDFFSIRGKGVYMLTLFHKHVWEDKTHSLTRKRVCCFCGKVEIFLSGKWIVYAK